MRSQTLRALVIEDDSEDVLLLGRMLGRQGDAGFRIEFESAGSLGEGLAKLATAEPDVVLLDLMLPDSRGLSTARSVLERFPEVPLVVLTGMNDEGLGLEAVRLGAQDYIVKGSADSRALRRVVSYAVHRHRAAAGLKAIIERSADGMVVVGGAGLVRCANPAARALLEGRAGALAGRPFPLALPAAGSAEVRLGDAEEPRVAELRVADIVWDDEPAVLVVMRDITDLRRVAELQAQVKESRRMDKLKDELMSAISHEMRNPLTVIKAANINVLDGSQGPLSPDQERMLDLQQKNIERLEKILNHILDLARLESGRAVIKPTCFDAGKVVSEVFRGFELLAAGRGLRMEAALPARLPPAYADPDLLAEVLGNLLDNALRFTGSRITVKAEALAGVRAVAAGSGADAPEPASLRFCVEDDGCGIKPERLGEVFQRFVQVDRPAGGAAYKGTGLGLAICKEIVERQGGRIWAESVPGRGAAFYFTLPVGRPDERA
ncbi:MAG: response regulator [Elusimicrobia bacterium]|nr:response regulator [Elusimicrobiota bacterium]